MTVATQNYFTHRPSDVNYDGYWGTVVDPDGVTRTRTEEREQYLDDIKDELAFLKGLPVGRLLDIGCGLGWLLGELPEWDRFGIEPTRASTPFRIGRDYVMALHDPLKAEFFDVVVMYHVIEHMKHPLKELTKAWELLRPGGILLLATPDFDSPCARRFGTNYRLLHDQTHISLFTNESMRRLLTDYQFIIDRVEFPYFETRHFTEENLLRMIDTTKMSPPFVGNFMTFYCHKPDA